jgi:hypothetical protein
MRFSIILFKNNLRPNWNHRFESWGSDTSLDTNISKIDGCHILMSYASFDIKILHKSIWLILVSNVALGPQLYNLWL